MSKNHNLEVLINLGFDKNEAVIALQQAKGQLDRALDILYVHSKNNQEEF